MRSIISFGFVLFCLVSSQISFAQYYGGGGYGGGMGRQRMGGDIPQAEQKFSPPDPEKVAEEETKWMKKYLKITEEQLPMIEDMNLKYASMRSDLFALLGDKPDQDKMNMISPKLSKLHEAKEKELQAFLKPEQWEKYVKETKKGRK